MPNIRTYQPEIRGGAATGLSVESWSTAARNTSRLYSAAAESISSAGRTISDTVKGVGDAYIRGEENREISHGAPIFAGGQAQLGQEMNAEMRSGDPNDRSVLGNFMENRFEPWAEQFREAFRTDRGRQWAEQRINSFREHLWTRGAADMSTRAGLAAQTNVVQMINALSNSVRSDPTSMDFTLSTLDHSISSIIASAPGLTPEQNERLRTTLLQSGREAIVKSAIQGAITANPEAGMRLAQDPRYMPFISGADVQQMQSYARAQERARRADESYARTLEREERVARSREIEGQIQAQIFNPPQATDSSGEVDRPPAPSASQIMANQDILPETRRTLVGLIERQSRPDPPSRVSNQTSAEIMRRMTELPPGDPNRINEVSQITHFYNREQLTQANYVFLRETLLTRNAEGENFQRAQAAFTSTIRQAIMTHSIMSAADPNQTLKWLEYTTMVGQRVADERRAGRDPMRLFDASSPDYLGRPQVVQPYQVPIGSSIRTRALSVGGREPQPESGALGKRTDETGIDIPYWPSGSATGKPGIFIPHFPPRGGIVRETLDSIFGGSGGPPAPPASEEMQEALRRGRGT